MGERADSYRFRAQQAAERGNAAKDPEIKRVYEEMARSWLQLAAQWDKIENSPPHSN